MNKQSEFTWREDLSICLAMFGVQLRSGVMNQWGAYFYSPSARVRRTICVSVCADLRTVKPGEMKKYQGLAR